jgi:hypothetical protein
LFIFQGSSVALYLNASTPELIKPRTAIAAPVHEPDIIPIIIVKSIVYELISTSNSIVEVIVFVLLGGFIGCLGDPSNDDQQRDRGT